MGIAFVDALAQVLAAALPDALADALGICLTNVNQPVFNAKRFGAIGDGTVHPLSEKFSSLAMAQVVYPRALALTETLDWHGTQKAIDMALQAGGGTAFNPAGTYCMEDKTWLQFPMWNDRQPNPRPVYDNNGKCTSAPIIWQGAVKDGTRIMWDKDKGSAYPGGTTIVGVEYAIGFGDNPGEPTNALANHRHGNNAMAGHLFQDLCLVGPARKASFASNPDETQHLDKPGCFMSGICWAARCRMNRVRVSWFYANVDFVGDHTPFYDCSFYRGYYNSIANNSSRTMYGDLVFFKCGWELARKADIGIAFGGSIGNWSFFGRCFIGQAPYAILQEARPVSIPAPYVATDNPMAKVHFHDTFFEGLGNAIFADASLWVRGAPFAQLDNITLESATLTTWNDDLKLPGRDRCLFQCLIINGGAWYDFTSIDVQNFTRPAFDIYGPMYGEFTLRGDVEKFLTACAASGVAPISIGINGYDLYAPLFRLEHTVGSGDVGPWTGRFYGAYTGDTTAKNDYVGTRFHGAAPMADGDQTLPLGIARTAAFPNNPPVSGDKAMMAVAETYFNVRVNTTGTVGFQKLMKLSTTPGKLAQATSLTDGRVVAWSTIVETSAAPGTARIRKCS